MVKYVKGNLLDSDCDYICHQVNCQGVMNSGIARQIRERWPEVYHDYREWFELITSNSAIMLGANTYTQVDDYAKTVVSMAAQYWYGYDGKKYTSYDAFNSCLNQIAIDIPKGKTIGFPKNIGCCRGGANWNIISTMIEEILGEDYDVYIYEYEPNKEVTA